MEYKIVEMKHDASKLEENVNRLIQEGWTPLGGIAVAYSPQTGHWWFYQAMVKQPAQVAPTER